MTLLITLAVAILIVLSAIAAYYLIKLKQAKMKQELAMESGRLAWLKKQQELAQDIRFIANAMIQGQCEITEGCLRLIPLMNRFHEELPFKQDFQTMLQHQQACKDMPTHDAYKQLSRKEQFKLDNQRYQLEEDNKVAILSEAKSLLKFHFEIEQIH